MPIANTPIISTVARKVARQAKPAAKTAAQAARENRKLLKELPQFNAKDFPSLQTNHSLPTKDVLDNTTKNNAPKLFTELKESTNPNATPLENLASVNQKNFARKVESAAKDMAKSFEQTLTKVTNFFKKIYDKVTAPFRWISNFIKKPFQKIFGKKAETTTNTATEATSAATQNTKTKAKAPAGPKQKID